MTTRIGEDGPLSTEAMVEDRLDPGPGVDGGADIYAVLGVRSDASRLLAREMYWSRIQPLLDPARRDDPDARTTIEALNDALAIVSDEELRGEYDRRFAAREREVVQWGAAGVASPVLRWIWRLVLVAGFASSAALVGAFTSWSYGLAAAGLLLLAPVVALLLRRGERASTPYERLGLRDDATRRDLEVAYQARAQEYLVRLGSDPRTVEALNQLDRDYLEAMRHLIAASGEATAPQVPATGGERSRAVALLRWLATALAAASLGAARAARVALSWGLSRGGQRVAAWRDGRAGRPSLRDARTRAPVRARPGLERVVPPPAPVAPVFDLEERLAASLKASTLEIARTAPRPVEPLPEVETPTAYLLLHASVGVRRVPIGQRPLRIGSAGDCDLVLPARDGVSPEHAMVWRRGGAVVLHATDPAVECQVNGEACSWATLEDGDELRIGQMRLQIEIAAAAGD